jgi:3-hydroxyacyl-[acyl-carrier-protein] dehydratase
MLQDSFYTLNAINIQSSTADITMQLNEKHPVYDGHFPGQPVVPGACLMQMVKEIIELIMKGKLQMVKADELKFLFPVNPVNDNILQGSIHYVIDDNDEINIIASFSQKNKVCFKCKALFMRK